MNRTLKQYWAYIAIILVATLLFLTNAPSWAASPSAPPHQTVPSPTPKPIDTPVPTATPVALPEEDRNDQEATEEEPTDQGSAPEAIEEADQGQSSSAEETPSQTATAPVADDSPSVETKAEEPVADPALQQASTYSAVVNATALNARSGPGLDFSVIDVLPFEQSIEVIGRNEEATWWYICCLPTTGTQGWVSGEFVIANFDSGDAIPVREAQAIEPLAAPSVEPLAQIQDVDTEAPSATIETAELEATEAIEVEVESASVEPATPLDLTITQNPEFVWQGQELTLKFVITNSSDTAAFNVTLRDELPASLLFIQAETVLRGEIELETMADGSTILTILWPRLPANARARATVTLQIASAFPDGGVIDNLAVVDAEDREANTSGISIGMPPTRLPDFK